MATSLLPQSPLAKRICDIFHRRHTTPWLPKEKRAFLLIRDSIDEQDLRNIERRYKKLWPPMREKNTLRHDLYTWLNNYTTEADKANQWAEQNPEKPKPRVIIPYSPPPSNEPPPVLSAEEEQRAAQFSAEMLRRNPNSKAFQRQLSSFQKVKAIMQQ